MKLSAEDRHRLDSTMRPTYVRYGVVAWLCGATAIAYIHRSCIAVPAEQIQEDLSLTGKQMGMVLGSFYLVYALSQIPAGWLGDRKGSRLCLPLFASIWSLATASIGWAQGMISIVVSQVSNGMAQACVFPCAAMTLSKWFPASRRAFPLGLMGSFQSVGLIAANLVAAWLLLSMSWRFLFPLVSLLGFAWAIGFFLWFRDRPNQHAAVNEAELRFIREDDPIDETSDSKTFAAQSKPERTAPLWNAMLTSPTMGLICGQQFFRAAGYVFYQTWFPTYLVKTRGVELSELGWLSSLPPAAFVIAGPLGGALSDWIQGRTGNRRLSRQALAGCCMFTCALFFLLAHFIQSAVPAVAVITVGSFFAALGSPPGNVVTIDLSGKNVATVYSTMNMAGNTGATLSPLVVGALVDWTGDWNHVLLLFVGFYLATSVCWLFLNPNRPIFPEEPAIV